MSEAILDLSFPGAETLTVGPVPVLWLPPDAPLGDLDLTPEDERIAQDIKAPTRRSEFLRSRHLIRRLCSWAGTLAKAPDGSPAWPDGYRGSLTHKDGWIGLTLIPAADSSVGIDAEDVARLKPPFESKILNDAESRLLDSWSSGDARRRLEILAVCFSFKEALFKAIYPVGRRMFYFPDAEMTRFEQTTGEVTARLLVDASPMTPRGATVNGHFVDWQGKGRHFVLTSAILHGVADCGIRRRD